MYDGNQGSDRCGLPKHFLLYSRKYIYATCVGLYTVTMTSVAVVELQAALPIVCLDSFTSGARGEHTQEATG